MVQFHGLVGDGGTPGGEQGSGEFLRGSQMQVGEQGLSGPQQGDFGGLGLLDLYDEIRFRKNGGRLIHDAAAGLFILGGEESGADPGIALHENSVAVFDKLPGGGRGEGHAVFLRFDFGGDANDGLLHGWNLAWTSGYDRVEIAIFRAAFARAARR